MVLILAPSRKGKEMNKESTSTSTSTSSPWEAGDEAEVESARYEMKVTEALLTDLGYHRIFNVFLQECMLLNLKPSAAILALLKQQASHIATMLVLSEGVRDGNEARHTTTVQMLSKLFAEYLTAGIPEGLKKLDEVQAQKEQTQ